MIEPAKILVNPKIECKTVDLPAPFGPIKHKDCPRPIRRLKLCKISILPYPARRSLMVKYISPDASLSNFFTDGAFAAIEAASFAT